MCMSECMFWKPGGRTCKDSEKKLRTEETNKTDDREGKYGSNVS